jgi:hypothetical protein
MMCGALRYSLEAKPAAFGDIQQPLRGREIRLSAVIAVPLVAPARFLGK